MYLQVTYYGIRKSYVTKKKLKKSLKKLENKLEKIWNNIFNLPTLQMAEMKKLVYEVVDLLS